MAQEISTMYAAGLNSVEKTKADIISAIKNANTVVIGLLGMGGIGKTTLIQQIKNELRQSFTYVIMVTVSDNPNIRKLQNQIGERIGLHITHNIESTTERASRLLERLNNESILIVLDDVWNKLNLSTIGIPRGNGKNKCCKIILTTRNGDVCKQMNASPIIPMACLNRNESWKLFESYSGILESDSIREIAEAVCKECVGLPLAISIVASTLRHNKREFEWSNFLSKMRESNLKELDGIEAQVYKPLKLSYDHLESNHEKLCFLFCSLFPEDYEIHLHDLMCYGLGEGFVPCREKVSSLDSILILIDKLKSRGLLLDVASKDKMYVKMHDVVRHVAISIARNDEKLNFYTNFKDLTKWPEGGESETIKRISLMGNSIKHVDHNPKFHGKWMKSLFLNDNKYLETIADDFFEEMDDLHMLDMRGTDLDQSLPTSFQKLMKLRFFAISYYSYPSDGISLHDHLLSKKNLVVLILRDSRIPELTKEFGELVHLKVLDFKGTRIDIIRPNVLSKLEKLEELGMFGSFSQWNESDKDGNFVSFFELGSLKCLHTLELQVVDVKFVMSSKEVPLNFLSSLRFFTILLGGFELDDLNENVDIYEDIFDHSYQENNKILALSSSETFETISKWIIVLMEKTEKLNFNGCNSLTPFRIPVGSFKSLKMISIQDCKALRFIFLWNVAVCLVHLENLKVDDCSSLEVIVMKDNSDYYNEGQEPFPKLRKVELVRLQNLTSLWKHESEEIIKLSSLTVLGVWHCTKLKRLFFDENSAPNLSIFHCGSIQWFNELQWEDENAEDRFESIAEFHGF